MADDNNGVADSRRRCCEATPNRSFRAGGGTFNVANGSESSVGAASRLGGERCELNGVWKTVADVADKTGEVTYKNVDVMFTIVETSFASGNARCADVFVMFTDVVATFTHRDGM